MRKIFMSLIVVLAVSAVALIAYDHFYGEKRHEIRAAYSDPQGHKIEVVFFFAEDSMAEVTLNDGRNFLLSRGMSASGARYVNPDESFVLWIKGDTAFIEENGNRSFDGTLVETK